MVKKVEIKKRGLLDRVFGNQGVYLITRPDARTRTGQRVEYVGKSEKISRRLKEHEEAGRFDRGRDRVFQIKERSPRERRDIEAGLQQTFLPSRNKRVETTTSRDRKFKARWKL